MLAAGVGFGMVSMALVLVEAENAGRILAIALIGLALAVTGLLDQVRDRFREL